MGILSKKICVELGTFSIRLVYKGKLITELKSLQPIEKGHINFSESGNVKNDCKIEFESLIKSGLITNDKQFNKFVDSEIHRYIIPNAGIFRPALKPLVVVPDNASKIDILSIRVVFEELSSHEIYTIPSSLAFLVGIGLSVEKEPILIIDAGYGKISASIIFENKILCSNKINYGSSNFKETIKLSIKKNHDININNEDLEDLFNNYFSATINPRIVSKTISGTNSKNEFINKEIDIKGINEEISLYFALFDLELRELIYNFIESYSKELNSIILTGRLSKLNGFDQRIKALTNIPINIKNDKNYIIEGLIKLEPEFEKNELVTKISTKA